MMQKPLIASAFQPQYDSLRANLPAALLLTGADGVGLKYIAESLSPHIEEVLQPTDSKGSVDSTNGSISIEAIRNLYEQTRSRGKISTQIIIADADRMTKPAQQAFLKLLEEPPRGIHFILTSHHPASLLSTIRSRVQKTIVPMISASTSSKLLDAANIDATTKQQLLFTAVGRPGLLTRLIQNPREREGMNALMRDARDMIVGTPGRRLSVVFHYNSRQQALDLLDSALMLREFALSGHAKYSDIANIEHLIASHQNITAGGNVRLNLLRAMV